jgi:hypothetical protein
MHHEAFVGFLKNNIVGRVVDVGGGSGTLALAYRTAGGDAPWVILEPNALRVPDLPEDISVVDGFLEREALRMTGASSVVMCHMLEHAVDLRGAVDALTRELPDEGRICLAWPVLETWVQKGLAGALNFEHGVYLTVPCLLALFAEYGWNVVAQQAWAQNDTLFLAFARGKGGASAVRGDGMTAVPDYFESIRSQAIYFEQILKAWPGDAFLMPASIYAQALLAAGLSEHRFTALLDNAPVKQGRRLFGTDLQVREVSVLRSADRPIVVLKGGAHDAEISKELRAVRSDVHIVGSPGPADFAAISRDQAGL